MILSDCVKFRYLEGVATADVAFEAFGSSVEEAFENSALALFDVICDLTTVSEREKFKIRVENKDIENLLVDFLSELLYLRDAKKVLLKSFEISIKKNDAYVLDAVCSGEKFNKQHELRTEVKAVTYHMLEVKKENNNWKTRVVLDI